jgi:SH3 domain protein
MKKLISLLFVFIMLLFLFPGLLPALEPERRGYVDDMLWLTLREGPGNNYRSIKKLRSDTPVLIVKEYGRYFKIELESGQKGWVNKRFISFEVPKSHIIAQLRQANEGLKNKIKGLGAQAKPQIIKGTKAKTEAAAKAETEQLIREMKSLLKTAMDAAANSDLSFSDNKKEYKTLIEQLGKVREIVKENKSLHEKVESLSEKVASLQSKNPQTPIFFKADMIKWAFFGVGVLLLGWIFGHSISIRKRRSGSSLLD